MKKLVHGVGINDADYPVTKYADVKNENGKKLKKIVWVCPFYDKWQSMLGRCYSSKAQLHRPNYVGCSVCPEWLYFTNFKSWMEKKDWEDKCLDKDLLILDNKIYGPDTCLFVEPRVNTFLLECTSAQGVWPVGVSFQKFSGRFVARCQDMFSNKRKYLGIYDSPQEAHLAWLNFKTEQAKILASMQTDDRVAKALIWRYENYGS